MDLPAIRETFVSRYPEYINSVRALNRETRDQLRITHLFDKCKLPINKSELFDYLDTVPLKYAFFNLYLDERSLEYQILNLECNLLILTPLFGKLVNYGRLASYYKALTVMNMDNGSLYFRSEGNPGEANLSSSRNHTIDKLKTMSRDYESKNGEFFIDIKNYFNIINRRLSCFEIDPNYAKNTTKEHFIDVIKKLYNDKDDILSINLLDLYLTINAYILNIDVSNLFRYETIHKYDEFVQNTQVERQKLIDKIYSSIDNF